MVYHNHRKSASCTHVSALLHALVAVTTSGMDPNIEGSSAVSSDEEAQPVTSYLCKWKVPKKGKKATCQCQVLCSKSTIFRNSKKEKRQTSILGH